MPTLDAQLGGAMDTSALGQQLLSALAGPVGQLAGVDFSVDTSGISAAASGSALDASPLDSAITRLQGQLLPALESLPGIGDVVRPLESTLRLVEQITTQDLATRLGALGETLGRELDGQRNSGLLAALLRVADVLHDAPEGRALVDLLFSLLGAAGVDRPARFPLGDELPALDGSVRVLGGGMAVESTLTEAERLSGLLARQLDPDGVARQIALAENSLGSGDDSLQSFITGLSADDQAGVAAAIAAVSTFVERVEDVRRDLTAALAFGDATLTYLDVDRVQAELDVGLGMLRGADLDPLGRIAGRLATQAAPLLAFDLLSLPARGLDALFTELEGKIGELAGAISALDVERVVQPIGAGLGAVTSALEQVSAVFEQITLTFQSAIGSVRDLVAALPLRDIADAIRSVLAPLASVIDTIRSLIADVKAALELAANTVRSALGQIDGLLEGFKTQIDQLFADAKALVEQLDLSALLGQLSASIRSFAELLAQAQMKPAFDTAVDAIGGAADVIGAVPFGLLPDSMKAEVDAAVKPIKDTDVSAVEAQIEALLQIEDGKFALNDELRAALHEIQEEYKQVIDTIKGFDPRQVLQQVDEKLDEIAAQVQALTPALTLQEVRDAVNHVRDAITQFDIDEKLQPVRDVFTQIHSTLDQYAPSQWLGPIEARFTAAREQLLAAVRFREWGPTLDELSQRALGLLDRFDPAQLTPLLEGAFTELSRLLSRFPNAKLSASAGSMIAALLGAGGLRLQPASFDSVLDWLSGTSASDALNGRAEHIARAFEQARDGLQALDLAAAAPRLIAGANALAPALAQLRAALSPDDPKAQQLEVLGSRLTLAVTFGDLEAKRREFASAIERSAGLAEALRRTGFSEVEASLARARNALAPLAPLRDQFRRLLGLIGLSGSDRGLGEVLRAIFMVITPARLVGLIMPLFAAVRERVQALVNGVLTPVQDGIAELDRLVAAIDLAPLRAALDGLFDEVKAQINALNPDEILKEPLDAWKALQEELATADPVGQVIAILDGVRDAVAAVLTKLSLERLLETPLAIYDAVIAQLEALNVEHLFDPVFSELDQLAHDVDEGLDRTVTAFQRLQAALPSGGGGSSVSAGVSIG